MRKTTPSGLQVSTAVFRNLAAIVATVVLATTVATATPAACVDPCGVNATGVGFLPPVTVLASGSTVTWSTTEETSHSTGDGTSGTPSCFHANVGYGEFFAPIKFTIESGALFATTPAFEGDPGETRECTSAQMSPSGQFVLPFQCIVHSWMRGALVVEPEGL